MNFFELKAVQQVTYCDAKNPGTHRSGKNKDTFCLTTRDGEPAIFIVNTDRLSGFDRLLGCVAQKGEILNRLAWWWFEQTRSIVPNHCIGLIGGRGLLCKKCKVFPIEFVVRGYLTGSTSTSIWTHYAKGARRYCGNRLPEGLEEHCVLPEIIITPTTKDDQHDQLITPEQIVKNKIMTAEEWAFCKKKALSLFRYGQKVCRANGIILVDTKYEFGKDTNGDILLIDEIHTPDSSRFWELDNYEDRLSHGEKPQSYDKDIARNFYRSNCDPYNDAKLIPLPVQVAHDLHAGYANLFQRLTGSPFIPTENNRWSETIRQLGHWLGHNLTNTTLTVDYWDADRSSVPFTSSLNNKDRRPIVYVIMGSKSDEEFTKVIVQHLSLRAYIPSEDPKNMSFDIRVRTASAHKEPLTVLEILEDAKSSDRPCVMLTIAGRSNALSGFVAANCAFPTIACPPFKDNTDMMVNIHSTLQMPSCTPVLTILDRGNCVEAVCRILNLI